MQEAQRKRNMTDEQTISQRCTTRLLREFKSGEERLKQFFKGTYYVEDKNKMAVLVTTIGGRDAQREFRFLKKALRFTSSEPIQTISLWQY